MTGTDSDGYHMPYTPPRRDPDLDDFAEEPTPTAEDLDVRRPPVGLSRAERRDFMRDEAERIARLQDRTRRNPLARKPPRGLGRAGRREWRQTDKARRKDWMERERARSGATGGPGALIVAGVLSAVLLARILFTSDAPPGQPPAPRVAVSTVAPPPTIATPPQGE